MLVLAGCLSTPLAAQNRAWTGGLAATLGGGWQVEVTDIGMVRRVRAGPMRFASVVLRLGSFVNEGQILGGARGFVAGLGLGVRTAAARIAEVGQETNPSVLGVELTVEAAGYLASNSPLPQRSRWAGVSVLPGLRFGAGGVQYSVWFGPTVFFDRHETDIHPFLLFRFEAPLARRERRPLG